MGLLAGAEIAGVVAIVGVAGTQTLTLYTLGSKRRGSASGRLSASREVRVNIRESQQKERQAMIANSLQEVAPGLFLGKGAAAYAPNVLSKFKISAVVCISEEPFPQDVNTLFVKLHDSPMENISTHFETSNTFLQQNCSESTPALVRCYSAGGSSAALILAYLMRHYQLSLEDAFLKVQQVAPEVVPNPGFWSQLEAYEIMLRGGRTSLPLHQLAMLHLQKVWGPDLQEALANRAIISCLQPGYEKPNWWEIEECYKQMLAAQNGVAM